MSSNQPTQAPKEDVCDKARRLMPKPFICYDHDMFTEKECTLTEFIKVYTYEELRMRLIDDNKEFADALWKCTERYRKH